MLLQKLHQSLTAGFGQISGLPGSLLYAFFSLLVWISAGQPKNGDPATCCCRSFIGALQLALALIFLALCCIYSIACWSQWSGYLLASHKMEVLQFAVAEVPLEPCSRPWPYFWLPSFMLLAGLDICWPVTKWRSSI